MYNKYSFSRGPDVQYNILSMCFNVLYRNILCIIRLGLKFEFKSWFLKTLFTAKRITSCFRISMTPACLVMDPGAPQMYRATNYACNISHWFTFFLSSCIIHFRRPRAVTLCWPHRIKVTIPFPSGHTAMSTRKRRRKERYSFSLLRTYMHHSIRTSVQILRYVLQPWSKR